MNEEQIQQEDCDDDWTPDPNFKDSILKKIVVNFTDKQIQNNKLKDSNLPYDPSNVLKFAQEVKNKLDEEDNSEDDDDDPTLNTYQSKQQKERFQEQLLKEQIYYDPLEDDLNERWVDSKMKKHEDTDGTVLSCPQCFIQLCYNSQRHEIYHQQYRAIIVQNCIIDSNKVCKPMEDKKNKRSNKKEPIEIYFAVQCAQCDAHVANFEVSNKIYHFFHVIPGIG